MTARELLQKVETAIQEDAKRSGYERTGWGIDTELLLAIKAHLLDDIQKEPKIEITP